MDQYSGKQKILNKPKQEHSRAFRVIKQSIGIVLAIGVILFNYSPIVQRICDLPATISIYEGSKVELNISLPNDWFQYEYADNSVAQVVETGVVSSGLVDSTRVEIVPQQCGNTSISIKLFGILPIKSMDLSVLPEKRLVPGGQSVGVAMYTEGILVVGSTEISNENGVLVSPAKLCGLETGDIICEANGTIINNSAQFADIIEKSGGNSISLKIERDDGYHQISITPIKDKQDGVYRLAIWVRDSTSGIGTLTFYDQDTGVFGALGHGIRDGDTGTLLTVKEGILLASTIVGIRPGQRGSPGELYGIYSVDQSELGDITENTEFGIYGRAAHPISNSLYEQSLPIATQSQVHTGDATILSTINENGIEEYSCKITKVIHSEEPSSKNMVLEITDERLLTATGGIVQGMSGSPILQDGHIIGAVTHVFINNPTQGYGIFIKWMINSE